MTRDVVTVTPSTPVAAALRRLGYDADSPALETGSD